MCATHLKTSRQRRSIRWLWVEEPTKKLPLLGTLLSSINRQTCKFSPPWSVRTLDGQPYSWVAFRKKSATVPLLLFVGQCKKVTNRENPSIALWITNPQVIRLWWPSRCQRLFGPATEYAHRETVIAQRILTLRGSTHARHFRTCSRCIFNPSDLKWPKIMEVPTKQPCSFKKALTLLPNCSSVMSLKRDRWVRPNSDTLW